MKSLMMLLVCCLCTGCMSDANVEKTNKATLSGNGDLVGTLPDGREVRHYEIHRSGLVNPHHIYVVEGSTTTNHRVHKHDAVEVIIDDTIFVPKETP